MKVWNFSGTNFYNSVKETSSDDEPSKSYQEALESCREALRETSFIYSPVDVVSSPLVQELTPALQAVAVSTTPFNILPMNSEENVKEEQFMMYENDKALVEDGGGDRVEEMADEIFNNVITDDEFFDDNLITLLI